MMTPINILPEYSEQFDVVLLQLMKAKHAMGSSVKKDSANPFHKSKYASLGAHLDLCEDILFSHGLLLMHTTNFLDGVPMIIATLHHPESKQWTKSYLPLPNPKNDSQGVGASVTYMRRYSINAMLGLNAEDDDGETASGRGQYAKREEAAQKAQAKVATQQVGAPPAPVQPSNSMLNAVEKPLMNTQQINALTTIESKLDNECKSKLHSWMTNTYKTTKFNEIASENYQRIYSGFENALKFMQDQQKQSKIQRLEVAHA